MSYRNFKKKIFYLKDYNRDFVGLSREELLKYANDPYWIRLRWIFFLGFWLVWFVMLLIAIIIVIYTPKCNSPNDLWYVNLALDPN